MRLVGKWKGEAGKVVSCKAVDNNLVRERFACQILARRKRH